MNGNDDSIRMRPFGPCDFQYVGRGCPCKDLAYFLTDVCDANDETLHDELVDCYFEALLATLPPTAAPPSRQTFDVFLDLAYCDYLRFLFAWRGQHQQQKESLPPRRPRMTRPSTYLASTSKVGVVPIIHFNTMKMVPSVPITNCIKHSGVAVVVLIAIVMIVAVAVAVIVVIVVAAAVVVVIVVVVVY